jgi:hypothetical protein
MIIEFFRFIFHSFNDRFELKKKFPFKYFKKEITKRDSNFIETELPNLSKQNSKI